MIGVGENTGLAKVSGEELCHCSKQERRSIRSWEIQEKLVAPFIRWNALGLICNEISERYSGNVAYDSCRTWTHERWPSIKCFALLKWSSDIFWSSKKYIDISLQWNVKCWIIRDYYQSRERAICFSTKEPNCSHGTVLLMDLFSTIFLYHD